MNLYMPFKVRHLFKCFSAVVTFKFLHTIMNYLMFNEAIFLCEWLAALITYKFFLITMYPLMSN